MKKKPLLTIGSAVIPADYAGWWATYNEIRTHHRSVCERVEFIAVNNRPGEKGSEDIKDRLLGKFSTHMAGCKYVEAGERWGTAYPRNKIFQHASGLFTLCCDPHISFEPEQLELTLQHIEKNMDSMDLYTGPMIYDDKDTCATHFDDQFRGGMWGTWGSAWETPHGINVSTSKDEATGMLQLHYLGMGFKPYKIIHVPYEGHERKLKEMGYRMLGWDNNDLFEIPGQGLGMFMCRTDAWLGFNKDFNAFGGEEMYIHEKFRKAGRRCLCAGFMKWGHRFGYPTGNPYRAPLFDRIRNYVIGFKELGRDLKPIYDHFVVNGYTDQKNQVVNKMSQKEWDELIKNPLDPKWVADRSKPTAPPPAEPKPISEEAASLQPVNENVTLDSIFDEVVQIPRDLNEHMPKLRALASGIHHVTEFSHRRESLLAFVAGCKERVVSYNLEADNPLVKTILSQAPQLQLASKDSPEVPVIEQTDLLFLDTVHTAERLQQELDKYAGSVNRFIVLHDTVLHAHTDQFGKSPGFCSVLEKFAVGKDKEWFLADHNPNQYGLTVLSRNPVDRPHLRPIFWELGYGPGTEQHKILTNTLGIPMKKSCGCSARMKQMDAWGVAGCRKQREMIIEWMRQGAEAWGWGQFFRAAADTEGMNPTQMEAYHKAEIEEIEKWFVADPNAVEPNYAPPDAKLTTAQIAAIGWRMTKSGLATKLKWTDPFPGLVDLAIARAEELGYE